MEVYGQPVVDIFHNHKVFLIGIGFALHDHPKIGIAFIAFAMVVLAIDDLQVGMQEHDEPVSNFL